MSPLSCVSPPSASHRVSLALSHMGRAPSTAEASGPSWEGCRNFLGLGPSPCLSATNMGPLLSGGSSSYCLEYFNSLKWLPVLLYTG